MNPSQICRRFLWVFGLATVLVLGWTARSAPPRPNVVLIYADELGNDPNPQLYDLQADPGEVDNLAPRNPERVEAMRKRLETIRNRGGV